MLPTGKNEQDRQGHQNLCKKSRNMLFMWGIAVTGHTLDIISDITKTSDITKIQPQLHLNFIGCILQ